jgi:hypothetical protein
MVTAEDESARWLRIVLGILFWLLYLTAYQNRTVVEALRGQIEDSLNLLEGLIALGGLCGSGVVVFYDLCCFVRKGEEKGVNEIQRESKGDVDQQIQRTNGDQHRIQVHPRHPNQGHQ